MKKCDNTDFKGFRIRNLYVVKESSKIDKTRFIQFNKSRGYNIEKCVHLKDVVEELINKGRLTRYTQEDGQNDD